MTTPTDSEPVQKRLGDFEVLREVGRGGMGVVYEARQVSLNRKVALKVLSAGLGLTPKAVQRFRREAEAAARLHHTNIVPVYTTGEEQGTPYYAMELIDGPSLDRLIRQMRQGHGAPAAGDGQAPGSDPEQTGPYSGGGSKTSELVAASSSEFGSDSHYFDAVARAVAEVADALEYAHKSGVVHRDVKPSNLLVGPDGRLSLTDFGLARLLEEPGMTVSGEFVGTPRYMSPEQITAGRTPLDHRTDVYSLGATLYELLTGQPPFAGERQEQLLAQILHKEPRPPRRVNKKVPVDLETICLKALEKDPDRRYQTAGQMAEDLRRYVNRFAIAARRAGPLRRMGKWVRRQPGLAAGLACAILAVCVAGWFAYQAHEAEGQRRAEQRQNAIERALVAAMSGDFAAAQEYTRQAELLGASPGWVRLLNGVLAFHRGEFQDAVQELQQAVRLMPDSVAAKSVLAENYIAAGQFARAEEVLNEVEGLEPVSWEDLLFKGYAVGITDPVRGLQSLDTALARRESVCGRMYRAFIRGRRAEQTGDPADAERAVEDAAVARVLMGDKPVAVGVSIYAHVLAASAYARQGEASKQKDHLGSAARDVAALKRIQDRGGALDLIYPGWYYDYVGQEEAALEQWRRGAGTGNSMVVNCYVAALWRRGDFAKALEACERVAEETRGTSTEVSRVYVLAELDRPRAHRSYQELIERTGGRNLTFSPCGQYPTMPRLLGDNNGADTLSQDLRRSIRLHPLGRAVWSQAVLDYNCGLRSDDRLLAAAAASRWDQLEAHFHVALRHLANGQRNVAQEHFRAVLAYSDTLNFFEVPWSRAFLARMEQDPAWPPWIGMKTDEPKP